MKILVIGSGGREHAIVWKIKQCSQVNKIYCAPGNPGIGTIAECVEIKPDDVKGLLSFALINKIDLTVVGPEIPLQEGIVNEFEKVGLKIFGPTKEAARLETSKIFAKDFMLRHNIPTAKYRTFNSHTKTEAVQYLGSLIYPVVIKADGLAAGKGVVICKNKLEAFDVLKEFFENKIFGAAGENIVVEEFLLGREASVFAITDGKDFVVLPPAQDHKKVGDNDTGKNTGGMGSYSPASKVVTPEVMEKIKERVIIPVIEGMKEEGCEFKGCLYCGLMIDHYNDPYVIEFNVRFGDPETQAVLPLISSDFAELLQASAVYKISDYKLTTSNQNYCCIVLASGGYPDKYETGKEITGLDKISDQCIVFHAGTKSASGKIYSSGGRVLNIVGFSGSDLKEAIDEAYLNADLIKFENKYYRKDIALKGV
jgi:phosphoribosylamine---glycine ligase